MIIKLENGNTIQPVHFENVTRGKGVWATSIKKPDHIDLSAETYQDRIEFRGYNTKTLQGRIAPFYFKEGESPAMSHIKQLQVIENLIDNLL